MGSKTTKPWSFKTGERGTNRVRAYDDPNAGAILLEFYERDPGSSFAKRKRVSTGHRDREKAKAQAEALAGRLRRDEQPRADNLTLGELFDIYEREVTPLKGASKRAHDVRCSEMFGRFLGRSTKPNVLNARDWNRFIADRRVGRIAPAQVRKKRSVRSRVIAYDLKWLLSVLNWATTAGDGRGGRLLDRNPLAGLPVPNDGTPQRALLSDEQYDAMGAAAANVSPRLALALVIAYETGHRINSVRQLRWSDVDLERALVRWRAENDKIGFEHETPLTEPAISALLAERALRPAIGDAWLFPSPDDSNRPCDRYHFQNDWNRAALIAKLPKGTRLGWHSLRRRFATDFKHVPLADLAYMGGWKEPMTIVKCYQRPDEETQRRALASRVRVVGSSRQ
jgi:integrase